MKEQKQSVKRILSNNLFLFQICFTAAPFCMIMMIMEGIKASFHNFLEFTYGTKYILEVVEFHKPVILAIRFLIILLIYLAIDHLISAYYSEYLFPRTKPVILKALRMKLFEKSKELDLECYDDPKFYNEFVLAVSESEKCLDRLLTGITAFSQGLTLVILSGTYFLTIDAGAIVFVVVPFILTITIGQTMNKLKYKLRLEKNPLERKRAYVHRVFYLNEYAKELRMSPDIKNKLFEDFDESNRKLYLTEKKYTTKCWIYGFVRRYICNAFIGDAMFIIYLVYKAAVLHVISYSSVVVLFGSAGSIKGNLRSLADAIPGVTENSLYIEKIRTFLKYEKKIVSKEEGSVPNEPKKMELKNISFAYKEEDGNILKNISMTINPYEKIALVGYNGAGKTTLVKLLMRLYDVSEGEILLDGVNIKNYDVEEYHNKLGVVFQDYKIFAATVGENVWMDDMDAILADMEEEEKEKFHNQVRKESNTALKEAGFSERLSSLKKGMDTPLTTEFDEDGVNLSGGESQKLAIARVLYKDANIIILDEPSSALDPIAEYQLNKTMQSATKNRTVIFISHRLSTTRDADRIYMLENGEIIEQGNHLELLQINGKYAKMWRAQAGRYAG